MSGPKNFVGLVRRERVLYFSDNRQAIERLENFAKNNGIDTFDGTSTNDVDEVDRLPDSLVVTTFDLICYGFSIFTYLMDILLDIAVAYMHYENERYLSSGFVIAFVLIPSMILNLLACVWWLDDELIRNSRTNRSTHLSEDAAIRQENGQKGDEGKGGDIQSTSHLSNLFSNKNEKFKFSRSDIALRMLFCVLQLGPVLWYVEVIRAAFFYRKNVDDIVDEDSDRITSTKRRRFSESVIQFYYEMAEAERDATLLRFFEAFLESIPQLLIQGFLAADTFRIFLAERKLDPNFVGSTKAEATENWLRLQLCSMGFSLLSAAWSIVSQHRCLRVASPDKHNMTAANSILQLLWRLLTITGRYICLLMFTLLFREWILILIMVHFTVSFLHISLLQQINRLDTSFGWLRALLLLLNAGIHLFTPFNMTEGSTCFQYFIAYSVEFLENLIIICLCHFVGTTSSSETDESGFNPSTTDFFPFKVELTVMACGCFALGIGCMLLYYARFHPNECQKRSPDSVTAELALFGDKSKAFIMPIDDIDHPPITTAAVKSMRLGN